MFSYGQIKKDNKTMIEVKVEQFHRNFIEQNAHRQNLGGFSNLASNDLGKSSRLGFQYTGLYGELAWQIFRRGNIDFLRKLLDHKSATLGLGKKGDNGYDDEITHNGHTRFIDVKTSHITDETQIPRLNLVVPEREYHQKMIYVAAFTIGKSSTDRLDVGKVVLAGWIPNEKVVDRWPYDAKKYAVKVPDLRSLSALQKLFDKETNV